jgi:crotonobetainyl-CoA:carnitine CoA-transferase CaiB-like acyl-CoA transferase
MITVPCSMPDGTVLKPAASARRTVSSGRQVVAMSTSPICWPNRWLRTAPPTTRASSPPLGEHSQDFLQRLAAQPVGVDGLAAHL